MKLFIYYTLKDSAWGGGNQFLKALRKELLFCSSYADNAEDADVILFNSHHQLGDILKYKRLHPNKIFIHRVDGPLFLTRGGWRNRFIDKVIFSFSEKIADVTVMQSRWSKKYSEKYGYKEKKFDKVIYNATDDALFNKTNKSMFSRDRKINLVASSWSSNIRKGFDVYKFLDENLDFSKYNFTFVGNSPIKFQHIRHLSPLSSKDLSLELKKADIFITASKNDPCSNSLIEALSCGLPAIVFDDGGHPELIGQGGEVFTDKNQLIKKIDKVVQDYEKYQKSLPIFSFEKTVGEYLALADKVRTKSKSNLPLFSYFWLRLCVWFLKFT